jgi:exodeoxyribonuclease V beta subunit
MKALTTESFHRDLQALIGKSQGSMALEAVPNHQRGLAIQAHPSAVGNARVFRRSLNNRWRIASFSSLTAGHHMSEPWLEEPLDTDRDVAMGEIGLPEDQVSEQSIFGFPKGSRAGLFFHDVLEHWDFQIDRQSDRQTLITEKLKAYGFESHWRAVVDEMLKMLATVYLPNPWSSFQLQAVSNKQRINEMAFYFPLKPVTVTKVRQAFALSVESPATGGLFDAALKRLEFTPVEGFLKGFVDLIFEYQGRYYIADWKSNHLGNRLDAYAPERLEQVMINEDYFLQYHLYVVALDQYLRQKMLGYDYERHFGGVYYIFLRGIHPDKDHYGIYYTRPEAEMIDRLQRILIHEDIN